MSISSNIHVIGYPKVGTIWLCRLLGDVLDSPVGSVFKEWSDKDIAHEGQERPGDYYIGHGHMTIGEMDVPPYVISNSNARESRLAIMKRDPKDVVVSAMNHWDIGSIDETMDLMDEGGFPLHHGRGIKDWYGNWRGAPEIDCVTSYERLLYHPRQELARILSRLRLAPSRGLNGAIKRQSFDERRKYTMEHGDDMSYGKEIQMKHLRKGIVGDWKNHFTVDDVNKFERLFGELSRELGYRVA